MASSSALSTNDLRTKRRSKEERSISQKMLQPKERICNVVLRDEDEETDDEDLALNLNSAVGRMWRFFH